ncbi:ABCC2.2 family protein [Megaselia abdita]
MVHPLDDFCGSQFWNVTEIWYSESLKIPYCFEQTVLVWTPCAFLWIFAAMEIYFMKKSFSRNIPWNLYNRFKLIANLTLVIYTTVDLILAIIRRLSGEIIFDVDFVTPIVKILTFCLATFLVVGNRRYGIRSSGILFLFWFFLLVLSIPQLHTEIQHQSQRTIKSETDWQDYKYKSFIVFFSLVLLNFLFTCIGDKEPIENKYPKTNMDCPETYASFLSRVTFHWFDSMIWKGYKNPLQEQDLWDLKPEDKSKEIMPTFAYYWNKTVRSNKTMKPSKKPSKDYTVNFDNPLIIEAKKESSVLPSICKTFKEPFIIGSLYELLQISLTYSSPILLRLIISFVERKFSEDKEPLWKGILYVILLFTCAAIQTLLASQYIKSMSIIGMKIRTALINTIYRKYLVVSNSARKESTVGEIVNLMAVDAERFLFMTLYLNIFWSAPLQIIVCLYFLWNVIGPSVLAGLAVMLLMIPINGWMANFTKKLQVKQMLHKDKRVKMMNEILNGIKVLKLYAWEPSFEETINGTREKELKTLKGKAYVMAGTFFAWTSVPFFVSLASFATFVMVDENNVLDAQTAFVALSLFNILKRPLTILPMMISNLIQTLVSVKRIDKFMNSEELDPDNVQHDQKHAKTPVLIENGTFSWGADEVCIKNINLKAKKGSLVAVVGAVGCGKTSLISAILGEMDKLKGDVNTVGKIAYVPQQAWLRNCTLRENILFGLPYDRKKYERVVNACALKADIEMLSAGDKTEIGEKGINLSGGQKQRISLARAVYSDSDVFLFDDPLSAVDSHVGKHIFDEVIGPHGILSRKTKVLVTHGVVFLPQVDNIYVMKDGEITESGTYKELFEASGEFSEFLHNHAKEELEKEDNLKASISRSFSRSESKSDAESIASFSSLRRRKNSTESFYSTHSELDIDNSGKLIQDEGAETGNVKAVVYKRYLKSIGWKSTGACLFFSIAYQVFQIYSNLWLTEWSNDAEASNDHSKRDMYIGVYGALGLGQAISIYLSFLLIGLGCLYSARVMHNLLLRSVFHWPMELFDTTPVGRILNRFSKDINTLDNTLPELLLMFVSQVFTVIGTIVVISISSPLFLIVVVPIFILYYLVQRFYVATTRQLARLESVTRSPIYSHFGESISGVVSIRAYKAQKSFVEDNDNFVDRNQVCKYPSIIAARWLAVRLEMVSNLTVLFAALFAILGNQENAALVGLSITYALQITTSMNYLVNNMSLLESNIVSVERINEYEDTKQEAEWNIERTTPNKIWPEEGRVQFSDYKVRYREGLDLVLRGINFEVKGGEKIGIVGRTGAGKSSLTLALFRIIEAAGGKIFIDGIDISTLGLHALRSRLTIIPQDPVLFSGSLRMNLDPFETKSDEDIWRALELAHLKSFVKSLTAGLSHEVSEGGENLSVGQRQLICLARALLRKTKVLILDEATAAIDLETDDLIQKTIRTEFNDCTVLTIAHRLNTIMDSDRVIVLDKGEISEYASPSDLLKNEKSIFYSMAKDANIVS